MSFYKFNCVLEFEDVDAYGIAHHSKLINLLERARVHFFHEGGIHVQSGEFSLVMVDMETRFLAPARMLEPLEVRLGVLRLSGLSVFWDYQILNAQGLLILSAKVRQASVSRDTFKPVRFPEAVRVLLEKLSPLETI